MTRPDPEQCDACHAVLDFAGHAEYPREAPEASEARDGRGQQSTLYQPDCRLEASCVSYAPSTQSRQRRLLAGC